MCSVFVACNVFQDTKEIWEYKITYPVIVTPVVSGDHVYIGSDKLYCLEKRTGKTVWEFETFGPVSSDIVVSNGYIYFQCGGMYCIDEATGKLRWEFWRADWADKTPAVDEGFVYAANKNKLYCFVAQSGKVVWKIEFKDNVSAPAVAEANVYLQADGELFCLNKRTGESVWKISTETETSPAVLQGSVFVIDSNKILCLDAKKGEILWSNDFNRSYPARGAVSEHSVIERAFCFNSASGKLEWESDPEKSLAVIPLVSGSNLYVRSNDSRLNCLNRKTGTRFWDILAPPGGWTITDKNILISSTDGKICWLRIS
jgi:outer membrane protein assembly factor BamB